MAKDLWVNEDKFDTINLSTDSWQSETKYKLSKVTIEKSVHIHLVIGWHNVYLGSNVIGEQSEILAFIYSRKNIISEGIEELKALF